MIPAGSFQMGDSFDEGYPADGEAPVHTIELEAFRMDTTAVTNEQFAAFVDATGYRTEAEKYGTSAVFPPGSASPDQRHPWCCFRFPMVAHRQGGRLGPPDRPGTALVKYP